MRWFRKTRRGTRVFTFSREMTAEEAAEVSRHMDAAFEKLRESFDHLDDAFKAIDTRGQRG